MPDSSARCAQAEGEGPTAAAGAASSIVRNSAERAAALNHSTTVGEWVRGLLARTVGSKHQMRLTQLHERGPPSCTHSRCSKRIEYDIPHLSCSLPLTCIGPHTAKKKKSETQLQQGVRKITSTSDTPATVHYKHGCLAAICQHTFRCLRRDVLIGRAAKKCNWQIAWRGTRCECTGCEGGVQFACSSVPLRLAVECSSVKQCASRRR